MGCNFFPHESNFVHVYTFLNVCIVTLVLCTGERSVCELWRRIPSPCLVLSIELAFAAMHARTQYCCFESVQVLILPSVGLRSRLSATWDSRFGITSRVHICSLGSRSRRRDRGMLMLAWAYCR